MSLREAPTHPSHCFQSRNRVSYLFKQSRHRTTPAAWPSSFNLGIEYLIFSSWIAAIIESCGLAGFNLGIEYLIFFKLAELEANEKHLCEFQSRNRVSYLFKLCPQCLLLSTKSSLFQSRNRVSLSFQADPNVLHAQTPSSFQSRNQVSYLFKSKQFGDAGYEVILVSIS